MPRRSLLCFLAASAAFFAVPASSLAGLTITEMVAVNIDGPPDKDGDYSAWIEVRNDSPAEADLRDWFLTNDPDDLTMWKIPLKKVPANGYALVYVSGKNFGSLFQTEVHASFKLSTDTEYLALVEPDAATVAHAYEGIPRQRPGYSYGLDENGEPAYFRTETPLAPNENRIDGFVADTKFSVDRGFYDEPFEVAIRTETPGATIVYSTSGRDPSTGSLFTGPIEHIYDGPITIDKTTVLRAAAFKTGLGPTNIDTQTYLFVDDVIKQPKMRAAITESAQYSPLMADALTSIPSLSIAINNTEHLVKRGLGQTLFKDGLSVNDYESEISIEWLNADGADGFQLNAGVSRFGGYYTDLEKYSYRLQFRKRYGTGMLKYPIFRGFENGVAPAEEFDAFNLRSGSHDMNQRGAYLSNRFVDDTMLEMGGMAPHGRFVHLYLNGEYWGQYHLRERWNAAMHASYFGGSEDDYDAINGNDNFTSDFGAYDGDLVYWREVEGLARGDSPWEALQGHVDLADYYDFMMVWAAGNSESEFQAVGSKPLGVPFTFYMKDADGWLLESAFSSAAGRSRFTMRGPGGFNTELASEKHPDHQIFLADRIHKHFFNGGAMTPERTIARLQRRVDEIETAFIAESARWNRHSPSRWRSFQQNVMDNHLITLTEAMIKAFKDSGAYPDGIQAPIFNQHGGAIEKGFEFRMSAGTLFKPEAGALLYTLDGADPRLPGGIRSENAMEYEKLGPGLRLDESVTVRARTWRSSIFSSGTWSALTAATFQIGKRPTVGDLVISEIHYNPARPTEEEFAAGFESRGEFEFIELYNKSDVTLSLLELAFTLGIHFDFKNATIQELAPGEAAVLVGNPAAFEHRYGTGLPVAGSFAGFKLSDSGETLRVSLIDGVVLQELTYNDKKPWPVEADGDGPSLTLKDPGIMDGSEATHWRASASMGGTPGRIETDDPTTIDQDGDGLSAFLEYALGTSDTDPASGPASFSLRQELLEIDGQTSPYWIFETSRNPAATHVVFILEVSFDLKTWEDAVALFDSAGLGEPSPGAVKWRSRNPVTAGDSALFLRLRVSRD
ncbi:MAG TPA: chitobiase/beta-hexosaminidase C-terminal domain-containing protein [Verrucomicrobiales bacterium]|nr:chitobiase/beta-hexosaminidase C-terminal domain-containing protein [Verrucomicrobiales bacterium]